MVPVGKHISKGHRHSPSTAQLDPSLQAGELAPLYRNTLQSGAQTSLSISSYFVSFSPSLLTSSPISRCPTWCYKEFILFYTLDSPTNGLMLRLLLAHGETAV